MTKKQAKLAVWSAKQAASESKYANLNPKGPEIHRFSKLMDCENQDVCGEMPVHDNQGELCLNESERMKARVEHYKGSSKC